jgi:hypothetical protein
VGDKTCFLFYAFLKLQALVRCNRKYTFEVCGRKRQSDLAFKDTAAVTSERAFCKITKEIKFH